MARMSWDYVIVGAGSAGATLAARLSEDPSANVLLLEAGPDYRSAETPSSFQTRALDMMPDRNPAFWWPAVTARRNPAQEPFRYARGRGVGGSSTVNGLCAIRGMPEDYDDWAKLGAHGWSYEDVLPSLIKLEDDHDFSAASYHGSGGPVPVYREPESGWSGMDHAFRDAALTAGFSWHEDHNAPGSGGVSPFAMNVRDGRRVSTNDGYLEPARDRPNLVIRGDCHVDTLTFRAGSVVSGVQLVGGERIGISDGGEVLLAAGAVHSPAILMRSGIGPSADLASLGIEVVADLPVGAGLQDHAMITVPAPVVDDARRAAGDRVTNLILRYSSGHADAGANDMFVLPNIGSTRAFPSSVVIQQVQVFSRGRLSLASRDPLVDPAIELNLLTDERDLIRMRDSVDVVADLLHQPAFAAIMAGSPEFPDKDDLPRQVRDVVHMVATCPMGDPADGQRTVVDPDCRVLGVEGVRVIDASVIPTVTRANTHLSTVMVAEQMATRMSA